GKEIKVSQSTRSYVEDFWLMRKIYSEEKIEKAGIKKRFENNNLNQCIKEIEQEIVKK
ncbi:hypothetical protein OBE_10263, partial [human gut metagenome]